MGTDYGPVHEGRLFRLRLERSAAARADAMASVRQLPTGLWQARVGGRLRGRLVTAISRARVLALVKAHYDAALLAFIARRRA